jgi:RHS repeat-associated protein
LRKLGVGTLVAHQNWRGQFARGTFAAGDSAGRSSDCRSYPPSGGCIPVAWPGWNTTAWHEKVGSEQTTGYEHYWFGSLAVGMRDASGQMYMRNRYYDPATGQFTQPDPVGIAGGLNVYGFAAGDPVTYTDPFGLKARECPPCDDDEPEPRESGGINPLKMAVGVTNVVVGTVKAAAGVTQLLGAQATAPILFVSVPAGAAGTYNLVTGYGAVRREAQQFSESLDDPSGPTLKNLWGLAPFGQQYDDPGEPGPLQYFRGLAREFVQNPAAATKRAVKDFFSFE